MVFHILLDLDCILIFSEELMEGPVATLKRFLDISY